VHPIDFMDYIVQIDLCKYDWAVMSVLCAWALGFRVQTSWTNFIYVSFSSKLYLFCHL